MEALCKAQPVTVLDTFFGGTEAERRQSIRMMGWFGTHLGNPLDAIPESDLIGWCERDPATRYLTMASVASYLRGSEEDASSHWSAIALTILERAPDRVAVLKEFAERFQPSAWSGSLTAILEGRSALLVELEQHADPRVVEFSVAEKERLAKEIEAKRRFEADHDRLTDERFE